MKTPDRCRIGSPPVQKTAPQGYTSVFRATEDPPSGLLQLLFIQSRKVNSAKISTRLQYTQVAPPYAYYSGALY